MSERKENRKNRNEIKLNDQHLPDPWMNDSDANEKESLLNSFLDRIEQNLPDQKNEDDDKLTEIDHIDISDYPEIKVPEAVERKIEELRRISAGIESKKPVISQYSSDYFSQFKIDYTKCLNPSQLAAVVNTEQPLLVIAGAGSGKTRIIVYRVSYLIEKGVDPTSILLLTFTRKASKEMLDRAETLLQDKAVGKVTGGTFHSFAVFVLRKYANLLQLPHNFTIIDASDSEDVIDLIRTELKFGNKEKRFPKKSRLAEIISYSRNKQSSIREVVLTEYSGLKEFIPDIETIAVGYKKYKKISRSMDFDDLMELLRDALKRVPPFRRILQNTYRYIMVDEYQDTNSIQKEIIDLIGAGHKRVMVVGDDSQSIYAFRGANYENILRFPEVYPQCTVIKIEENYRSNQMVLNFTNAIIDNAKMGYKKRLFTKNENHLLPVISRLFNEEDEAMFIVDRISELIEQNISLNEIAVLNRADWHNRYIQAELNKRGIPYVVIGGFRFNERMHIKDMIAYLRICYNPLDAVAWHRILKYIGGIGRITASKLVSSLQGQEDPYNFKEYSQRKFYDELLKLGKMLAMASLPEYSLTQKTEIIRDYYAPLIKARETDYNNRLQDVDVLIRLSTKYKDLNKFLSDFALDPPSKYIANQTTPLIDESEESGKITISTIHSAKGLEWYSVFVPHVLEGLFPSNRAKNIEDMEEERRLFYVACSRAKEELHITFPRFVYGYDAFFHLPGRFIMELAKDLYAKKEW